MVNLNARSNLTPDSTPWGKAIEKRLSDLERGVGLLPGEIKNMWTGLNSLTQRVGGLNIASGSTSNTDYGLNTLGYPIAVNGAGSILSNTNPFEMPLMAPGPQVPINTRTGVLDIAGVLSIQVLAQAEVWVGAMIRSEDNSFSYFPPHPFGGDGVTYLTTTGADQIDAVPIHVTIPRERAITPGLVTVEPLVWVRYMFSSTSSFAFTYDPRVTVTTY